MSAPRENGPLIEPERMAFLDPVSRLYATNPFEPAWDELLERALRDDYVPVNEVKASRGDLYGNNPASLTEPLGRSLAVIGDRLAHGVEGTPRELSVYHGAALFYLWEELGPRLQGLIDEDGVAAPFYDELADDCRSLFGHRGLSTPEPAHLLALFYQAKRAFHFTATRILGRSPGAAAARASIWRASMTGDVCTYAEDLYRSMDEIPVLITGETGTGKDLAASCIGWSRYIPFDAGARRFARKHTQDYHVRNVIETASGVLESALFGHKKGAFTGATADAEGCFDLPKEHGTLFLDEAGEIPEHVQVKLLRPLQNREHVPVGGTAPRKLAGRLVFATHRDLEAMCREGTFRRDLYERMNGFRIHMPPLREMIVEAPAEVRVYVRGFVARKIKSPDRVEEWTDRVTGAIEATRADHPWPGNLRELKNYTERCLLDGRPMPMPAASARAPTLEVVKPPPVKPPAVPLAAPPAAPELPEELTSTPPFGVLGPRAKAGELSLEELSGLYLAHVYMITGQNKAETTRRTGVERRRLQKWLDSARLGGRLKGDKKQH
jgi:DNA-binding NtrC family response regulator